MHEKIAIIDFGSQYTQLIARRVRELNIYSEIIPCFKADSIDGNVKGIILSGSPYSVLDSESPRIDMDMVFSFNVPVLGICYGAQLMAHLNGGEVSPSEHREYGRAKLQANSASELMAGMSAESQVWMSHGDTITKLPDGAENIGRTSDVQNAAYKFADRDVYCIQFHPEVTHSTEGKTLLKNFTMGICGCTADWTPAHFVQETVDKLKEKLNDDKVILGLSGGVDSSVAAILLNKAIGENLYCIFIDNGLLRKGEFEKVLEDYEGMGLNVKGVRAAERFYSELDGVSEPETKRKIIGRVFVELFEEESKKVEGAKWLGQGTIYPDVIESESVKGPSATIKSHHNVGGLPENMDLKIVEPLRELFKDEVRRVGKQMDMSPLILGRHPFPGPGLAIRILGAITEERVKILQEADAIFINILKEEGLYDDIWQAGVMFLPIRSVGVMGDERTYENVVSLRAVSSVDGMTADWHHIPYEVLGRISNEIINKVKGINRVVYDISSKPPATIEWE
jgi:GMP synthase (glutamine-hydrolysing)